MSRVPSLVWFRVSSSGAVQVLPVGGSPQRGAVLRAGDRFVGQLFPAPLERCAVWVLVGAPGRWAFEVPGRCGAAARLVLGPAGFSSRLFGCGVLLRPRGG